MAVRPSHSYRSVPSVLLSLEGGKPCNTPPIYAAVRLLVALQYASHLYGNTFEKAIGVRISGKFLKEDLVAS